LSLDGISILDNAAGFDIRKSKRFCQHLLAARFLNGCFENLAVEFHDAAVGSDGAPFHMDHACDLLVIFNLHVASFGAFLGEDLDTVIFRLRVAVGVCFGYIDDNVAVQDHGVEAGLLRIVLHREVFGRDRQPVVSAGGSRQRDENTTEADSADNDPANAVYAALLTYSPLRVVPGLGRDTRERAARTAPSLQIVTCGQRYIETERLSIAPSYLQTAFQTRDFGRSSRTPPLSMEPAQPRTHSRFGRLGEP
jgi:hypothetical protein